MIFNNRLWIFFCMKIELELYYMGQSNMEKIQSSLLDLRENNDIGEEQAKNFLTDFVRSGHNIQDVSKFIQNPSMELFLKHYINSIYQRPSKIDEGGVQEKEGSGCLQKEDQWHIIQDYEVQVKNKFKMASQIIRCTFLEGCQMQKIREIVNKFILSEINLKSYSFYLVDIQKKDIIFKNSKINFISRIEKTDPLYKKMLEIENAKGLKEKNEGYCCQILNKRQNIVDYFQLQLDPSYWIEDWHNLEIEMFMKNICLEIALFFEEIHQKQTLLGKVPQNFLVRKLCNFVMNMSELCISLQKVKLNKRLSICLRRDFNIMKSDVKNEGIQSFNRIFLEITKKIKIYKKQMNKNGQIYLDFNRFGILQFVYGMNYEHPVLQFIRNKVEGEEPKLSKIFQKHKKIIKYLKRINNGLVEQKVIKIDSSLKMQFNTNKKGSLMSLSIFLLLAEEKKLVKSFRLKKSDQSGTSSKSKNNIVEKICLQNPNFVKSGWFKQFLDTEMIKQDSNSYHCSLSDLQLTLSKKKNFSLQKFESHLDISQLIGFLDLESEDINILNYNGKQLDTFVIRIFSRLDFFRNLPHEKDEFPFFLKQLHQQYEVNQNAFHNFSHSVNVMHLAYLLTLSEKNKKIMNQLQIFTVIFSALCHDVAHTGYTNLFQINSNSHLSRTYNGNSPLQNFHASKSFQILRKPRNNFLSSLNRKKFSKFRQQFIANILHTDIKHHFHLIKEFQQQKNTIEAGNNLLLTNMIVHTSDFAGCVKTFGICQTWSDLLSEEFRKQYIEEGRLGIDQTPFMKDLKNMLIKSKNEAGFLRVIVQPLYESISHFYVNDQRVRKMLSNVTQNLYEWEKINFTEDLKEKNEKNE